LPKAGRLLGGKAASKEFEAFAVWYLRVIIKENSGPVMVRQGKFYRVFLAMIEIRCSIEEFKGYEPALRVNGFRLYDVTVDCPHRSGNKEGIDRIAPNGLNGRYHSAALTSANLDTGYFPAARRIGGLCSIGQGRRSSKKPKR
jgi:hypothetical protein